MFCSPSPAGSQQFTEFSQDLLLNSSSRIIFFYSLQTLILVHTHTLNEYYFCSSTGTGAQFGVIPKKVNLIFGLNLHQFLTQLYRNSLQHILCLSLHHLPYCTFCKRNIHWKKYQKMVDIMTARLYL